MKLYMIGNDDKRMLTVDVHNVSLCLVDIKKQKKWLHEVADMDVNEIVKVLDDLQGKRILKLLMGKITTLSGDSQLNNQWADEVWKPQTDKVVKFQEYDDSEVIEAFQEYYNKVQRAVVPKAFKNPLTKLVKKPVEVESPLERIKRLLKG